MNSTLVLGVGNTLLSDEGAGVHALMYLRDRYPATPGVEYLDGGTLSFTLADHLESADNLVVLDATDLGLPPGGVRCLVDDEMDEYLGSCKRSAHEVGLLDLLDICRLRESLPRHRALIGIQPATLDWGESVSPPVQRALDTAAREAHNLIQLWGRNSAHASRQAAAR